MTLNIHFPLKLNKSLAYLQTEICFDFYGIDFTITHETIEGFLGFFWNIKLMNNIKSDARKQNFGPHLNKLQNYIY